MKLYTMALLSWGVFLLVFIAEHLILSRVYGKTSSLQRILRPSTSAQTDLSVWSFYYFIIPLFKFSGVLAHAASLFALPGLAFLLTSFLTKYLEFHGIFGAIMPTQGIYAFVLWLLAHDLALYVSHVLMHRVPWLWNLHRLHHASTEMTIVNGSRVSLGEHWLNELAIFLLLNVVLGMPQPHLVFAILLCRRVIDLIQHSDLPFDYGWLGYIFASPRFHRMHHSSLPCDHDANFGNIFSFWDYIFGTVASRYRQSAAAADDCPLGLDSPGDTEMVNRDWRTAILQATLVDDIVSLVAWAKQRRAPRW